MIRRLQHRERNKTVVSVGVWRFVFVGTTGKPVWWTPRLRFGQQEDRKFDGKLVYSFGFGWLLACFELLVWRNHDKIVP